MQNYKIMLKNQRDLGILLQRDDENVGCRVLMFPNKYGFMFYFCPKMTSNHKFLTNKMIYYYL